MLAHNKRWCNNNFENVSPEIKYIDYIDTVNYSRNGKDTKKNGDYIGYERPMKMQNRPFVFAYITFAKKHLDIMLKIFNARKEGLEQVQSEHIKEHQNKKIQCECGGKYTLCNKLKHFQTKKHKAT